MRRWLLVGASIGCMVAGGGFLLAVKVQGPGPLATARDVVIPRGTTAGIAEALQRDGIIRDRFWFWLLAEATSWQGRLRAAELRFPARSSVLDVLLVLRTGRPVQHLLTIVEGMTSAQIGALLSREDALEGAIALPGEASILPQSYAFERGSSRSALLARARMAMGDAVDTAWRQRSADTATMTKREALIMASMVERETGLDAERPMVARVFLNRIRQGIRLQSDPTVIYGASGGLGRLDRPLTRGDLEVEGPYNTYVVPGLPSGPICNPGLASLLAVLHPAAGSALYFVADGKGGHSFAASLAEHDENVARYRLQQR